MDDLADKIQEAEKRRSQLARSFEEAKITVTVQQLTREIINFALAEFDVPGKAKSAIKKNPFFTSLLIAAAAYIAGGAFQKKFEENMMAESPDKPQGNENITCNEGDML